MEQEDLSESNSSLLKRDIKLPRLGLRSLKTIISSTLCAILYSLFERNATFACIGAVFGIENNGERPWKTGGNRLIGTIIGGFLGMGLFYLQSLSNSKLHRIFLLFIGIAFLIYISQILNCTGAIQGGAVVFYIVMLNTPENQYVSYALNRMLDTGIGVSMSIGINVLLSQEKISLFLKRITG